VLRCLPSHEAGRCAEWLNNRPPALYRLRVKAHTAIPVWAFLFSALRARSAILGGFWHVLRYTCLYGGQSVGRPRAAARRGAARARPRRSARSERGKPSSWGVPRHPGKRLAAQLAATLHHPAPSRKVIRALGNLRNGLTFTARITFRDGAGCCSVAASCAPSLFPGCLGTPHEDGFPLSDRAERR